MTIFYKFPLKVETSLAKWVVKPTSDTRQNVIVYIWLIYSFLDNKKKIKKTCNAKKNNSKCTTFTIRTKICH